MHEVRKRWLDDDRTEHKTYAGLLGVLGVVQTARCRGRRGIAWGTDRPGRAEREVTDQALTRLVAAVGMTAEVTHGRVAAGRSHQQADDVDGTIGTDDAIGFDPFPLLRALHQAGAAVTMIGQVAGIMHGSSELTGDLDLLWDGGAGQAPRLAAAFAAVGARLSDDDGAPIPCTADAFALPKVLFASPGASGDCCTPALPWGDLPVADFIPRSLLAVADDGLVVRYLALSDLICMRRAVGRPKDHRRADELEHLAAAKRERPQSGTSQPRE
ncbi:MAG TPA: hypothetical protein VGI64_22710 [Streptosporangiaceae bacterium]